MPGKNNSTKDFDVSGANNVIDGAGLGSELDDLLSQSATAEPTEVTAPEVAPTENFTNESKKPSNKKTVEYTTATSRAIGQVSAFVKKKAMENSGDTKAKAKELFGESTRIVGYITRTDAKIDFKRKLTPTNDAKTIMDYSFALNYYPPSKPDRVIVKYPLNLFSEIKNSNINNTIISTTATQAATDSDATGHNSEGIAILSLKNTNHELYDWISAYTAKPFLKEAEEIFEPFTTFSGKDNTPKTRGSYTDADLYKSTGGNPGICVKAQLVNKKSTKDAEGSIIKLDIINENNREFKITYTNTGRPRYVTPNNYIADKKWDVVRGSAASDNTEAVKKSLAYFKRFMNPNDLSTIKPTKKQMEDGVKFAPNPSSEITLEGNQQDNFIASCFKPGNDFWNTTKVQHWYNVVNVDGRIERYILKPEELDIVRRDEATSSSGEVTYRNAYSLLQPSGANGSHTWDTAIPAKVKSALGSAVNELTYQAYIEKRDASKSSEIKPKNRLAIDLFVSGVTFDELKDNIDKILSQQGSGSFGV